jgi:hypothetical protein
MRALPMKFGIWRAWGFKQSAPPSLSRLLKLFDLFDL